VLACGECTTIAAAIRELTTQLESYSDTPRLDAELIIAHSVEHPRSFLYTYPEQQLSHKIQELILGYLNRRLQGEPMPYILGHTQFWSLELTVTQDTLIPRPETEHLIEWALDHLPLNDACIADLGTGSGAIAIALAHGRPQWNIHATDTHANALNIAINNARKHQLSNIEFYLGDWCHALPQQKYTAIISNPPYIRDDDPHLADLHYEPASALIAAEHGLAAFKAIINTAKQYLVPNGKLILEHGYDQATALSQLLREAGFDHIDSQCDLAQQNAL